MAKSKYSRLTSADMERIAKRAIMLKEENPDLQWKQIAEGMGVRRVQLRDMVKRYKETHMKEGSHGIVNMGRTP